MKITNEDLLQQLIKSQEINAPTNQLVNLLSSFVHQILHNPRYLAFRDIGEDQIFAEIFADEDTKMAYWQKFDTIKSKHPYAYFHWAILAKILDLHQEKSKLT